MRVYGNHCNAGTISRVSQPEFKEQAHAPEPEPVVKRSYNKRISIVYIDGKNYSSLRQACKELDLSYNSVKNFLRYRGPKCNYKGHEIERIYVNG